MYTLAISVDLSDWECRQAIQQYLCYLQSKDRSIVSIVYDENNDVVRVSGAFDPNDLKRMLISKLRDKINGIDIKNDKEDEKNDENNDENMGEKEEECIPCRPQMYPWPPKLPMYPWPLQVTMVCFAPPCPCLTAWSNNYQDCTCGVESWPGRFGSRSRSGSGSRWGGGPRHGDRLQWGCEKSQQPNIIFESMPNIAYESPEQWGCEPSQQPNIIFESTPNIAYESTEQWDCEQSQQPNIIFESTPNIAYESTEQWDCEPSQQPSIVFESTPNIAYESTEPSCCIM